MDIRYIPRNPSVVVKGGLESVYLAPEVPAALPLCSLRFILSSFLFAWEGSRRSSQLSLYTIALSAMGAGSIGSFWPQELAFLNVIFYGFTLGLWNMGGINPNAFAPQLMPRLADEL